MTEGRQTERIRLGERIDSESAAGVEKEILAQLDGKENAAVILDASDLKYISSAGLRVLLRIRKSRPDLSITEVCPEVYDILEMTGFTEMMNVEKAYRVVSVEGCEEIGWGSNGTLYRIDQDNVVKVYNNADALSEIQHEREVAKLALILGIPTAISYNIVRVGDSYGSVFELLNARSFSEILAEDPEKMDWCVREYVDLLKKIHGTKVPEGKLPEIKETVLSWAAFLKDYLPEEAGEKLISLIRAVPPDDHMIHGDYHTKNLELMDGEVLLIDMDTLAVGHPVFELASMYNAFAGFSELDPEIVLRFQGFPRTVSVAFWRKALAAYLETDSEERIREVEDKARIIGYTRLIRRAIRRAEGSTEEGRAAIAHWTEELLELLEKTDTLLFDADVTLFGKASRFAAEKHSGMTRKSGNAPYILHPMEVAEIAGTMSSDEELLAAAVLHDTVEDTDTTIEEIESLFGARVAMLVASETENKRPGIPPEESWEIRKKESLEMLENADDPAVRILWLADKLSNMRSIYRMWMEQGDAAWEIFHEKDPEKQAWYYRSLDRLLSGLKEYPAWQEFHRLVETVFG